MSFSFLPQAQDDPYQARRMKLAEAMMLQGSQTGPVNTPIEGFGRLAQALAGAYGIKRGQEKFDEQNERDSVAGQTFLDALADPAKKPADALAAYRTAGGSRRGEAGIMQIAAQEQFGERKEAAKRNLAKQENDRMIREAHAAIEADQDIPTAQKEAYRRAAGVDPKGFMAKYGTAEFRRPPSLKDKYIGDPQRGIWNAETQTTVLPPQESANIRPVVVKDAQSETGWAYSGGQFTGMPAPPPAGAREPKITPAVTARLWSDATRAAEQYLKANPSNAATHEDRLAEQNALIDHFYNQRVNSLGGAQPQAQPQTQGATPQFAGPTNVATQTAQAPALPTGNVRAKLNINEEKQQRDILRNTGVAVDHLTSLIPRVQDAGQSVTGAFGAANRLYQNSKSALSLGGDEKVLKLESDLATAKTMIQGLLKVDSNMSAKERADLEAVSNNLSMGVGPEKAVLNLQAAIDIMERRRANAADYLKVPQDTYRKGNAVPAQTPPGLNERVIGRTYQTPRGPMIWRGEGWEPVQ